MLLGFNNMLPYNSYVGRMDSLRIASGATPVDLLMASKGAAIYENYLCLERRSYKSTIPTPD